MTQRRTGHETQECTGIINDSGYKHIQEMVYIPKLRGGGSRVSVAGWVAAGDPPKVVDVGGTVQEGQILECTPP